MCEENELAFHSILSRLESLNTTIKVNRFFPRMYFSSTFTVDRNFDPENKETYSILRDFIRKYSPPTTAGEESWASLAEKEIKTFQKYDAADLKKYVEITGLIPLNDVSSPSSTPETSNTSSSKSSTETPSSSMTSSNTTPKTAQEKKIPEKNTRSEIEAQKLNVKLASVATLPADKYAAQTAVLVPRTSLKNQNTLQTDSGSLGSCTSSKSSNDKSRRKNIFPWTNKKKCRLNGKSHLLNGEPKPETDGQSGK